MAYYWTCPECGSNNDPDEACDCQTEETKGAAPLARKRPQGTRPTQMIPVRNHIVKEECACRTA